MSKKIILVSIMLFSSVLSAQETVEGELSEELSDLLLNTTIGKESNLIINYDYEIVKYEIQHDTLYLYFSANSPFSYVLDVYAEVTSRQTDKYRIPFVFSKEGVKKLPKQYPKYVEVEKVIKETVEKWD